VITPYFKFPDWVKKVGIILVKYEGNKSKEKSAIIEPLTNTRIGDV
jgi:hypothetical protein